MRLSETIVELNVAAGEKRKGCGTVRPSSISGLLIGAAMLVKEFILVLVIPALLLRVRLFSGVDGIVFMERGIRENSQYKLQT